VGPVPFHSASTPSLRTILSRQSYMPVYGMLPAASGRMDMSRVLSTSTGLEVSDATPDAKNDAAMYLR
jgi:hypothetical protein